MTVLLADGFNRPNANPAGGNWTTVSGQGAFQILSNVLQSTAGNVRLRLTMSAGTWTPLRDSFFRVRRLAAGNVGTFVA
jgi:hypothetical protein